MRIKGANRYGNSYGVSWFAFLALRVIIITKTIVFLGCPYCRSVLWNCNRNCQLSHLCYNFCLYISFVCMCSFNCMASHILWIYAVSYFLWSCEHIISWYLVGSFDERALQSVVCCFACEACAIDNAEAADFNSREIHRSWCLFGLIIFCC